METIGDLLKNKRESKEFSQNTVSEETGISLEYIEALENNDFLKFKNKVYARSFLRDYSNFLCLDTHKILDDFEEEYVKLTEQKTEMSENEEVIEEDNAELPDTKSFLAKPVGIFVVFILLCLIAFYIGKMSNNKPIEPKTENPVVNETQTSVKPEAKAEVKTEKPNNELHQVVVYAHKDLWVRIKADGKPFYEGKIKAGANLPFNVKKSIQLRGGEPSGCQINVDGKSIGKLGTPGKPFDLTLTIGNNAVITQ